jgi:outer membrane receptor protein involved in Fe transport
MINSNSNLARRISLALASMGGMALSSAAIAQEDEALALEEVVVTAQKREQSLEEIPMSITVLGGNLLERQQAFDFADMVSLIPGFSITGSTPGVTRITLRGTNTGGVASTVGVYFDEVPFGSSTALANGAVVSGDFDTFDLNRVEVLRGPQGTLYGASSLGGVVRYVPNQPSTEGFEGSFRGGLEDVDGAGLGYNATGFVNVPLGDTFALRASAFYRENDGWVDTIGDSPLPSLTEPGVNVVDGTMVEEGINSSETSGGRIQALFQPNDEFSINLLAMFQNIQSDDSSDQEADPQTFEPLYPSPTSSRYQNAFDDISYDVYSATIEWEFSDWASLESVTSWGDFEQDLRDDIAVAANFTGGPPLASFLTFAFGTPMSSAQDQITSTDKFSQELRLVSAESTQFEWLAGIYYTDEDSLISQQLVALTPNTDTPISGFPLLADLDLISTYEEIAVFANATWFVTDRFELSFGARQSDNDQTVLQVGEGPLVGGASEFAGESSESPFTWSISPRFQLTEDSSIYLRAATGFRPGGPNVLPPTAPASVPSQYDSDNLTNYEIGYKANSANGRFILDLAGFYIDWEDIQLFALVEGFGVNVNGGTAVSKGVEFASSFAATEHLTLALNGAYTDAYLTSDAGAGGQDGDPLNFVPDWSFGLSADSEWAVGSGSTAYLGGTLAYTGERAIGRDIPGANGEVSYLGDYTSLNLRVGLDTGRWFYEIYAKNVTNELGVQSVGTANSPYTGHVTIGMMTPRTLGITAGARF